MGGVAGAAVELRSVNTGRPARLGVDGGRVVRSAIHKHPVSVDTLELGATNLEGDRQSDLRVHGGPDKALYVYPAEHLEAWERELGAAGHDVARLFVPGSIGENLTVAGWDEQRTHIGDVWEWGDALVQVAQPREPCFKLGLRTGIAVMVRLFETSGRSGWYLRVLRPGTVPVRTPLQLRVVERDGRGLSVHAAARLLRGRPPRAQLEAAVDHPALAAAWRRGLQRRLALHDADNGTPA